MSSRGSVEAAGTEASANGVGSFTTGRPPFPGVPARTAPIILQMHGVRFDHPGHYSFELLVDGHHLRSLPLHFVAGLADDEAAVDFDL